MSENEAGESYGLFRAQKMCIDHKEKLSKVDRGLSQYVDGFFDGLDTCIKLIGMAAEIKKETEESIAAMHKVFEVA